MAGADDKKNKEQEAQGTPPETRLYSTPGHDPNQTLDTGPAAALSDPNLAPLAERFELLQELGRGGMGVVYKARDRETGGVIALKVLNPAIANDPAMLDRFKNELLLAHKITHKNVCRTHDLHRFGETSVITMEFVEGETLRGLLRRRQGVSLRYGLEVARQICSGLKEAHARGVVHRDLKPENLMVDLEGNLKIMDFGIARSIEAAATLTEGITGTPAYMAPEQAEGKEGDQRTDIYALGLVLYELFTGEMAFQGDTPIAVAHKQMYEAPASLRKHEPWLHPQLEEHILKCLEKNPKHRFQSVEDLEAALAAEPAGVAVAGEGEAETVEAPLPPRLTRWQRSDWALVATALIGLALFFPFFHRTSLATRAKVTFDRSVLLRIAQDYAERLGAKVEGPGEISHVIPRTSLYLYAAKQAGAQAAFDLTGEPLPYWEWVIQWKSGSQTVSRVYVDNEGSLILFERKPPATPEKELSLDEALQQAEKLLLEEFGREAADLTLTEQTKTLEEIYFVWEYPETFHGIERSYDIRFAGGALRHLHERYNTPAGFRGSFAVWQLLPGMLFVLIPLVYGIRQRKRVQGNAGWRTVLVVLTFSFGAWLNWRMRMIDEPTLLFLFSMFLGLSSALMMFFISIGCERAVVLVWPEKFAAVLRLFGGRIVSEPCGLALTRGTLLGLGLLGLDTLLVWAATQVPGVLLDEARHIIFLAWPYLRSPAPAVQQFFEILQQSLFIPLIAMFVVSLLARLGWRPYRVILVSAAVVAVGIFSPFTTLGAIQPFYAKYALLVLESLALVWVFYRYDLLTLAGTVFTFSFWWMNYTLLVMFEPTGATGPWVAFALWGLLVLAAVVAAFQQPLRANLRRLSAAVE